MNLVTLQQARAHLRSDETDDDADLEMKIAAASASVLDYVGDFALNFLDEFGLPLEVEGVAMPVPSRIQQATLIMVAYLYNERDGSNKHAEPNYLPAGVTAQLYSLRRPTAI